MLRRQGRGRGHHRRSVRPAPRPSRATPPSVLSRPAPQPTSSPPSSSTRQATTSRRATRAAASSCSSAMRWYAPRPHDGRPDRGVLTRPVRRAPRHAPTEKELRVQVLHRVPVARARVRLPQVPGDRGEDQQDQVVQTTERRTLPSIDQRCVVLVSLCPLSLAERRLAIQTRQSSYGKCSKSSYEWSPRATS